jgi:hypothetical protein
VDVEIVGKAIKELAGKSLEEMEKEIDSEEFQEAFKDRKTFFFIPPKKATYRIVYGVPLDPGRQAVFTTPLRNGVDKRVFLFDPVEKGWIIKNWKRIVPKIRDYIFTWAKENDFPFWTELKKVANV